MGDGTPEAWGVAAGFWDAEGTWQTASPETLAAVMAAIRPEGSAPTTAATLVVHPGEQPEVPEPELMTEDGAELQIRGRLPADLPLGYHRLRADGGERRLVVAPVRCHLPDDLWGWGFAVQLYSLLSDESQGVGDLAELHRLGRWARDLGARFLLLSPLHAALPGLPQEPSPYYPSSRRFMNPIYLRVDGAPPFYPEGLIDRDAVWNVKIGTLEQQWEARRGQLAGDVEAFMARTPGLEDYATFCALSERYGRPWQSWPEEYRRPGTAATSRFAVEQQARVLFHAWLQLELDHQLVAAAAGASHPRGVVTDLAVGVRPDGADAWSFQDAMAPGMSVGAPPDPFNPAGQDWGLSPFAPWRLAAAGFEPFVQTVRAAFRHAAGIRVDHVMGLFRLYWIPAGQGANAGAYVAYPHRELLDILALESVRAGGFVIGEDLGTVQPEVRAELQQRDVLSYRLLWFEPGHPRDYPQQALAAITTHDLPTLMGVWTGEDPLPGVRERLQWETGLSPEARPEEVLERAYALLAEAPSRLLAATLEDVTLTVRRPNLPGRLQPNNWSRPLPLRLEALLTSPQALAVARALGAGQRR
jgi:4-alpha-glucanotransferase